MKYNQTCCSISKCIPLSIRKIDSVSGAGISGVVFGLTSCNNLICSGTTDANGDLVFYIPPCIAFVLQELSTPPNYLPNDTTYNLFADVCGRIFVDGVFTPQLVIRNTPISFSFTAIKVNAENSMPLAGAVYALYMGSSEIARTVSNATGQVTFTDLSPGTYDLVEITPPPGFQMDTQSLVVIVSQNGSITIMGQPANGFILSNIPLNEQELSFLKLDESTGLPVVGATFALTQNGTVINTIVSGTDGLVNFGVLPAGTYQLTETVASPGYEPNSNVYQVVVAADGAITINGLSISDFAIANIPILISDPPVFDFIYEGDTVITGTGVPGSEVVVTLPDGTELTTTVEPDGTWSVDVPADEELVVGDILTAIQTEPGKLPSIEVPTTVLPDYDPFLTKSIANLSTPGSSIYLPGDTLQFIVRAGNAGSPDSFWPSVVITDALPADVTFIPDTVALNGALISMGTGQGQYTFDSATTTLTVYVGNIGGGVTETLTFSVLANLDATGTIQNTVRASVVSRIELIATASIDMGSP
ncbi:MAG: Ig-like domain-containing protein [Oscillospiraceae bacterium]|nr:Ig-like domain-containing protein [Oscillospiraceae bacterium]